ncbi:hypothetical protein NC652_018421 [Populus alba x Populus x berolinensis]|uniref:Uncharacterized protein n=1 Tax=Populus alba x Populus x berolinensis TaxID=444605 RepID=A0AAD6QG45_9ROSI|nr:hypothetical protein NC652_018421 [Populus alba x Populus x berolinensis]KAJ6989767.1 hypothetical protein NC653_018308 [Populus alba x Populus x berolinensis]
MYSKSKIQGYTIPRIKEDSYVVP